ncbi:hypothetical protein M0D69_27005 [Caballeronia sp. SEWSISQ10-4 2]|uniref:hypothetical protein n=1 Tax=Caballeronia sp. SEWSISQ10-4 2 TaxID=2937438 RepID=UPI002650A117|nr:hypothetical protein [Caballeronia sp. SEWSISQ10-4 2]MDN7181587.1 hypothetical protein [Caballeronia sp. SEWSISQ10-4 2]
MTRYGLRMDEPGEGPEETVGKSPVVGGPARSKKIRAQAEKTACRYYPEDEKSASPRVSDAFKPSL